MTRTLLFQGDSITDADRVRSRALANQPEALGRGYAMLAAAKLLAREPGGTLLCLNRGISGNQVPDLLARWQTDCLALRPDVLSILIGVNDLWHRLDGKSSGSVDSYRSGYRQLLELSLSELPDCRILLCEPFVLRTGAVDERWFPEFDERRAVARQLAQDLCHGFVPFQAIFDEAVAAGTEPRAWAEDGVHPSLAGHELMAQAWCREYEKLS